MRALTSSPLLGVSARLGVSAPSAPRDEDINWFRAFTERATWTFARTYVESYPHEWTHERDTGEDALARAVECIERWGIVESFWRSQRKYLYVDGRKYWHMGEPGSADPEKRPTLINRSWVDVSRYREQAARLGWEGERLEALVKHWDRKLADSRLS